MYIYLENDVQMTNKRSQAGCEMGTLWNMVSAFSRTPGSPNGTRKTTEIFHTQFSMCVPVCLVSAQTIDKFLALTFNSFVVYHKTLIYCR